MFTDLYGDMGEIVVALVAPVASVQTLAAELMTTYQYDPEEWE